MIVNTYGISVGIAKIGWKLYLVSWLNGPSEVNILTRFQVYIAWIMIELVIIYFFFVETAGKTCKYSLGYNTDLKHLLIIPNKFSGGVERNLRGEEPKESFYQKGQGCYG